MYIDLDVSNFVGKIEFFCIASKLSIIVNAYRACGIYPVNRNAIKVQPSLVYQSSEHIATSSAKNICISHIGIGAPNLALQALEADCFTKRDMKKAMTLQMIHFLAKIE